MTEEKSLRSPLDVVAALGAAIAIWSMAAPLNDYDAFWHADLGGRILQTRGLHDLPSWWLGVPQPRDWVTSQWLAEVVMHLVVSAAGFGGLIAVRVLLMTLLVGMLWRGLVRGRQPYAAVPVFIATVAVVAGVFQDRPQTAGIVLAGWLGIAGVRLFATGRRPALWLTAMLCLLWAQVHGSWIIAPVAFLLIAAGLALDPATRTRERIRPALLLVGCSLAGLLNPYGPISFLLPIRFSEVGGTITEWWPTTMNDGFTVVWGLMVAAVVVAWALTGRRVAPVEVLWVVAWTAFGLQSFRNVTPALLLIAPVVVLALERWLESRRGSRSPVRRGARESTIIGAVCFALVAGAAALTLVRVPGVDVYKDVPARPMAEWIAAQPAPVRVFNDWNATGALIGLSGGRARLVIDGRADLWGETYIESIQNAERMQPGWQATVAAFDPDAVVVPNSVALVSGLQLQGWRVELTDGYFTLLVPRYAASDAG